MTRNDIVHSSEEKKFYSLRELVPEIMEYKDPPKGLTHDEHYDTFRADYKKIQRLVRAIKKTIGNNKSNKISAKDKEGFVTTTKLLMRELFNNAFPSKIQKSIATKINTGNDLVDEELTYLIDLFQATIDVHMNLEDRDLLLQKIEKSDSFYKWKAEIEGAFLDDILLIEKIEHPLHQIEMMEKYREVFKKSQSFIDLRESVKKLILTEDRIKEIVHYAEIMGLDPVPILRGEDEEGLKTVVLAMQFADNI